MLRGIFLSLLMALISPAFALVLQSNSDTTHLVRYQRLGDQYATTDPQRAHAYADSAMAIALKTEIPKYIAEVLTHIGSIHRKNGEYDSACMYLKRALDVSPESASWLSNVYLEAGITLLRMTRLDSALTVLQSGLSIVEQYPDRYVEGSLYNAIGNVRRQYDQFELALENYVHAIKIFESAGSHQGLTQALSNAGNIHNLMGNTDKALEYTLQALESARKAGIQSSVAYSLRLLGQIYRKRKNVDSALMMYQQAISIYSELNSKRDVSETELSLGNIYFDRSDYSSALKHYSSALSASKASGDSLLMTYVYVSRGITLLYMKQYAQAKKEMDTTLVLAAKLNLPAMRMDSYQVLSEIYNEERDYKTGQEYYKKYITVRDSLTRVQNHQKAQEIEARFQTEKKDDAIRVLNAENKLKSTQQIYLLIVLGLVVVLSIMLYNRYKVKTKANEKLKEIDRMKSRFFTNISHEFRTPLSLIIGPLEDILRKTSDDDQKRQFGLMHRNARRLQDLINQLLDLARLEAGSMALRLQVGDMTQTLRFVGSAFPSLAERKGIDYRQEIKANIRGCYDRDKVEKITNNLLSNAFKFTPEGGRVELRAEQHGGHCVIEVRDSGPGIPSDQLEKIFQRFYQIDETATRTAQGSGIGLALARELTELHRGTLTVQSREHEGSVFTVSVPIERDAYQGLVVDEAADEKQPDAVLESHETISQALNEDESTPVVLVAEDNEDMRSFIGDLLKDQYRLVMADNGVDALRLCREVVPDLMVCDWMMPRMDGRTLCERVKLDEVTSHIPVLMLTARADQESRISGLETGADDYLTKPFDAVELTVRTRNLIDQRKRLREHFSRELVLQPGNIALPSKDAEFLERVLNVVEKHHVHPGFSVDAFSENLNMSRMQLHRKLKALTGESPGEFLRRFRLERAKQLLSVRGAHISDVCFQVGYNSVSNFSRAFREANGITPSEFVNSILEQAK